MRRLNSINIMGTFFLFLLNYLGLGCAESSSDRIQTPVPIIGVVTQELFPDLEIEFPAYSNFIIATNTKALESSGARVVPIIVNRDETYYKKILKSINGVLLPGGFGKIGIGNPYYDAVRIIYKIGKQINDDGILFPILGVCLGFEFLITVANNDESILTKCDTFYENLPLQFLQFPNQTKLFSQLTDQQAHSLQNSNITFNWHKWCASIENFSETKLIEDWRITSTSTNNKSSEFIASIEHRKYPFFGVQFHPEKVPYDWKMTKLSSYEAIITNRYFFDFFVSHATLNDHKFDSIDEEKRWSIDRYPLTYRENDFAYNHIYLF